MKFALDMEKWTGRVRVGVGSFRLRVKQVTGKKRVILSRLYGFGSIGLRVKSGWVDPHFSHDFFF